MQKRALINAIPLHSMAFINLGRADFCGGRSLPQLLEDILLCLGGISTFGGECRILKGGNVNPENKDNGYFFLI